MSAESVEKSRSDSSIATSNSICKSSSVQLKRILIDDISAYSATAGDRIWATCYGAGEASDAVNVQFIHSNQEIDAIDISRKSDLIMFTAPSIRVDAETEITLKFSVNDQNFTTIPFKYSPTIARIQTTDESKYDSLVEFATNGDPISLLPLFVPFASKCDIDGNSVLHIASNNSQSFALKMILCVLPEESKQDIINIQNSHGLTALHCAIRAGDPDAVHYLMAHGARLDLEDSHGNTAIHFLSDAYNESIYKEILEPSKSQVYDINQVNAEGFTPLHMAVRKLKLSLMEMLIDSGANVNLVDREKKRNALMYAVEMNDPDAIQLLIDRGSNPNVEDVNAETPLSLAEKNVNYAILGYLLDQGADADKMNSRGVCLADSSDSVVQKIIKGERHELPKKETSLTMPNDLTSSRSPLFGRSHPDNTPEDEAFKDRLVKRSREEIINDAQNLLDEPDRVAPSIEIRSESEDEQIPGPSTSSSTSGRRRRSNNEWLSNKKMSDAICNLDYLTRIRLAKIFDMDKKWERLAQQLACDHMIELISICSVGDESSPTMILLDQYEQLANSSITNLREAVTQLGEDSAVKLIDQRYVYE